MAACEVIVKIDNAGALQVLKRAWVYCLAGTDVTVLRSDENGRLFSLGAGAEQKQPWAYTKRFKSTIGATLKVYYSRGALPIPGARLSEHTDVFYTRTLAAVPPDPPPNANVGPNSPPNTLVGVVTATITLPPVLITLTKPLEIRLWPILWELPADCDLDPACQAQHPVARTPDYHTAGFQQGSSIAWGNQARPLPVTPTGTAEHGAVDPPPDTVTFNHAPVQIRVREKAAHFEGTIDSRATGVTIQMFDRDGNIVQLRPTIDTSSAAVDHVAGTLTVSGASTTFKTDLFFVNAADTFGLVQLFVQSVGISPPIVEAFTGYLCGFQITLLDDATTNTSGAQRGQLDMDESNEKLIVDFTSSPHSARPDLREDVRFRRMHLYQLRNRERPFDPTAPAGPTNPDVWRPEMPLWMAEFHAVGVSSAPLTTLMALRGYFGGAAFDLTVQLNWEVRLSWKGPDVGTDTTSPYQYDTPFAQQQTIRMHFGTSGQFVDAAGANITLNAGELPDSMDPAPTPVSFPVAGRRLPKVLVSGQSRNWGRQNGAPTKETLVVENQLRIATTRNGIETESIRGGDGSLRADIRVDGTNVLAPAEPAPATRLPRFRIIGRNPTEDANVTAVENSIINPIVEEYFNQHAQDAWIQMLPLAMWQVTARRIFHQESGGYRQFNPTKTTTDFMGEDINLYYAKVLEMPYFGGPHGYGMVQVDYGAHPTTPARDQLLDEIWNFIDGVRGGVRHLMGPLPDGKAGAAYHDLGLTNPQHNLADTTRMQAVFQRAVVRRYNGGSEFIWSNGDFQIQPSSKKFVKSSAHEKGANPRLLYPNKILSTSVTYFTGDTVANRILTDSGPHPLTAADADARQVFTWPIAFGTGDFGPTN